MSLSVQRGDPTKADLRYRGHGCQVEAAGVYWAMDPAFRESYPEMFEDWSAAAHGGSLRPGDHRTTILEDGRAVLTLGIKQGMRDVVELDAIVRSIGSALGALSADAVAFHRIGTRCEGRLVWSTVRPALERVAATVEPDIVILVDAWDVLVDAVRVGDRLSATVHAVCHFGAFIDLGVEFPGFIDVVELSDRSLLQTGQVLDVQVLQLDDAHHQIRAFPVEPEMRASRTSPGSSIDR